MLVAMNLRLKAVFAVLAGALSICTVPVDAGSPKRPVIVELYTSQGCASCVPADALLAKLTKRADVIPMSLSVTYWDMLGWKDTLASETYTRRQKSYAETMGHSAVYTPQIIVDGVTDVVGGRDAQIETTIAARAADGQAVPVALSAGKNAVHVGVGASDIKDANATIWLFRVQPQATVAITDGENKGHTYTYHNVVREIRALGMWKGQPFSLDLPRQELLGASHDSLVVVVQQGGYGRILGAAMLEHTVLDTAR